MSSEQNSPETIIAPAWRGLIDDAAVFPPGSAPIPEAISNHAAHRAAWYAAAVGPLLLPVAGVSAFIETSTAQGIAPPHVALAVRPGTADIPAIIDACTTLNNHQGTTVTGVEMALPADQPQGLAAKQLISDMTAALGPDIALWLEVRSAPDLPDAATAIAGGGSTVGMKYRMGGTEAAGFPSIDQAFWVFQQAATAQCSLKLTAGLHHLHRFNDTQIGATHHGLGNVLACLHHLLAGSDEATAKAALACDDPATTNATLAGLTADEVTRLRSVMASFGCCGVTDPLDDLIAAGLQPAPAQ